MEEVKEEIKCFNCKKEIEIEIDPEKKPWITLSCDNGDFHIHGCSYLCSKHLGKYMGGSYWDKVVNKEDFLKDPIPYQFNKKTNTSEKLFINPELEQIKWEIEQEEKRIELMEQEMDYHSSCDEWSDDY